MLPYADISWRKNLVGTIKGRRSLSTADPDLEKFWNDRIRLLEIDGGRTMGHEGEKNP